MSKKPNERMVIHLPKPVAAKHECLPQAAMSLGAPAGQVRMVSRLVIEPTGEHYTLYRFDAGGGFVGDSCHPDLADALHQVRREFNFDATDQSGEPA